MHGAHGVLEHCSVSTPRHAILWMTAHHLVELLLLFRPTSWIRTHSISGIPDAPGFGVPWSWSSLCTPGRPGLRCACTALAQEATIRCSVHSWSCLSTPRDPGMSDDRSRSEVPLWPDLGSSSYGPRRGSGPSGSLALLREVSEQAARPATLPLTGWAWWW